MTASTKAAKRGGMRALGAATAKVTGPLFRKRGFAEAGILTNWPEIMGNVLAERTIPQRISYPKGERSDGTLYIRVESAWATELQHLAPQVIERINSYFGYRAVAQLAIRQGTVPSWTDAAPAAEPQPSNSGQPPPTAPSPTGEISKIDDEGLRVALASLDAAVQLHGKPSGNP
ncbi:MAG: DUF721 domain-containing protein [Alphaproteobacteria bacterium]